MSIYGNPVMLGGSGGGAGTENWMDNLAINWNFADPVNTRGQSQYSGSGVVNAINGWRQYNTTSAVVSGGITLEGGANFYQTPNATVVQNLLGKTCTMSVLAGSILESETFTIKSANGYQFDGGGRHEMSNGVSFWSYRDSSTVISISLGFEGTGTSPIIKAIKLELGSTQTLVHMESGVWVLNQSTTQEQETLLGSLLPSGVW